MARQTLPKTTAPGKNPTAGGQAITWTAEDIANHSMFALTGRELLLIWNTHASTTYTYTPYQTNDERGRALTVSPVNIPAGQIDCYGPTDLTGYRQTDGNFYIDANNAAVKFAVITLP
jgi:hypothetical protein